MTKLLSKGSFFRKTFKTMTGCCFAIAINRQIVKISAQLKIQTKGCNVFFSPSSTVSENFHTQLAASPVCAKHLAALHVAMYNILWTKIACNLYVRFCSDCQCHLAICQVVFEGVIACETLM
jgi:hypothetical protein